MNQHKCPEEAGVLEAVRSREWDRTLESHLVDCATCRETARAAQWMHTFAESHEASRALPDPELVWLKAQLSRKQAEGDRAILRRQLRWASVQALFAAAGALGLYRNWNVIQSALNWVVSGLSVLLQGMASLPVLPIASSLALGLIALWITWPPAPRLDRS